MEHHIDAENKVLGRLASEVAQLLRGKNDPTFTPRITPRIKVTVFNTDLICVTGNKMKQKVYRRYSGYHGGLKEERLDDRMKRDSRLAFRKAVLGMLAKNKSRAAIMKNLTLIKTEKE